VERWLRQEERLLSSEHARNIARGIYNRHKELQRAEAEAVSGDELPTPAPPVAEQPTPPPKLLPSDDLMEARNSLVQELQNVEEHHRRLVERYQDTDRRWIEMLLLEHQEELQRGVPAKPTEGESGE